MDRLELALRRYQQILPRPVDYARMPLRELNVWFNEDVTAVLDDYTRRPPFRENASWPVRALCHGASTAERDLIDRIDAALVHCGAALLTLASHRLVERKIQNSFSPSRMVPCGTVRITGTSIQRLPAEHRPSCELELERSHLRAIAERNWDDLVNVDDYFEPEQEWVDTTDGERLQRGEAIVSLNPELLPIGNFVVRRLLARIKLWLDILSSHRRRCLSALQHVRAMYTNDRQDFESAWANLTELNTELLRTFRTGPECRLRDACVAATQIYAAIHPDPDVTWLGIRPDVVTHAVPMLRSRVTGLHNDHYFDRIAVALGNLRQLYEGEHPNRSAIDEAIASGGLVIDTELHEVFWEAQETAKKPTRSAWDLIVALAQNARCRQNVEIRDVFGDKAVSDSALSTAWGRLKECLPASLWKLVTPGEQPRTYRLLLDGHRIHIFP